MPGRSLRTVAWLASEAALRESCPRKRDMLHLILRVLDQWSADENCMNVEGYPCISFFHQKKDQESK